MFALTKRQEEALRATIRDIRDGGDEAFAKHWLIWAEFQLVALAFETSAVAPQLVTQGVPLVAVCKDDSSKSIEEIHDILLQSIVRMLFQAKLDGRNSLEITDARKAVEYVKERCQE